LGSLALGSSEFELNALSPDRTHGSAVAQWQPGRNLPFESIFQTEQQFIM
jgi:hypothetical protein